jgi:hypothetical protein
MLENLGANEPTGNFHSFEQHQGSIYTIKFKIPNMPIKEVATSTYEGSR